MNKYLITFLAATLPALNGCSNDSDNRIEENAITKVDKGYMISIPNQIADKVSARKNVTLTLQRDKKDIGSVLGNIVKVNGGLLLESEQTLDTSLDKPNYGFVLHDPNSPASSCGAAEFGIDCFFAAPCAGTEYCLPGDGPGGFTCQCL